jgi:hypothetical protein
MNRAMAITILTETARSIRPASRRWLQGMKLARGPLFAFGTIFCTVAAVAAGEDPSLSTANAFDEQKPAYMTLGTSAYRTDNVALTQTGREEDTVLGVFSDFQWSSRDFSRLKLRLEGDVAYNHYTRGQLGNAFSGAALAHADLELLEDRLTWQVQDSIRQTRINELAPLTPDNIQETNLFSTGPRLRIPLGSPRFAMVIDGQYQRGSYSVDQDDTEGLIGQMSLVRTIGPRSSLALSATSRHISFISSGAAGYRSNEVVTQWRAKGARTEIGATAGYSVSTQAGTSIKAPHLRLDIERNLSDRSRLMLYAEHRVTGSAEANHFSQGGAGFGSRVSEFSASSEPFILENVGFEFAFTGAGSQMSIGGSVQKDRYEVSTQDDRKVTLLDFQVSKLVGADWTVGMLGSFSREQFLRRGGIKSTLTTGGAFVGYQFLPKTRADFSIVRNVRGIYLRRPDALENDVESFQG